MFTELISATFDVVPLAEFPGYGIDPGGWAWTCKVPPPICATRVKGWRPLKSFPTPSGYLFVRPFRDGRYHNRYLHLLVLDTFFGPRPPGLEARHLDDDKSNNRVDNLAWGTRAENVADKVRNGKQPRGSTQGMSRLTEDQIPLIRSLSASGEGHSSIARRLNVSPGTIALIVHRKTWRHVP